MKFLKILVVAACAACGALIGGADQSRATPMAGLLLGAPAVRSLEIPDAQASPVEKSYYYYRRHYYRPYYHRRYYRRHYYRPYYHRRYYNRYYW